MVESRPIPLTDIEIASLLKFYESFEGLAVFMSPSVQYFVKQTLKLLRHLEAGRLSE